MKELDFLVGLRVPRVLYIHRKQVRVWGYRAVGGVECMTLLSSCATGQLVAQGGWKVGVSSSQIISGQTYKGKIASAAK